MNHDLTASERALRRRLDAAVPDLPAPPDRLHAVQAQARRTRRRNGMAAVGAAAATLVTIGTAGVLSRGPVPDLAVPAALGSASASASEYGPDCGPTSKPGTMIPRPPVGAPGDLIPPGAVAVTHCRIESPDNSSSTARPLEFLTTGVDEMIARADALPRLDKVPVCAAVGQVSWDRLAFRYPDGHLVILTESPACGTVDTDKQTRRGGLQDILRH